MGLAATLFENLFKSSSKTWTTAADESAVRTLIPAASIVEQPVQGAAC